MSSFIEKFLGGGLLNALADKLLSGPQGQLLTGIAGPQAIRGAGSFLANSSPVQTGLLGPTIGGLLPQNPKPKKDNSNNTIGILGTLPQNNPYLNY